jgi:Fuc2NAc and GlcNAc transferase
LNVTFLAEIFILLMALSWLLTRSIRGYALTRLLDIPNARSSHALPTPRGGGLAIVLSVTAAVAVFDVLGLVPRVLSVALLPALALSLIGWIDDHGDVPARWRFLVQLIAGFWVVLTLNQGGWVTLGGVMLHLGWIGVLAGVLLIAWFINLFNFMDGIDGIEGVEVISIALGAAALMLAPVDGVGPEPTGFILIALSGATFGFLLWNWPPARIFMGDVGSGTLGFLLAVLMFYTAFAGKLSLLSWLILSGVFCVDATLTLLIRWARGERWYQAHRSHAYQHASRLFGQHRVVTLFVLGINVFWLFPIAWMAHMKPDLEVWLWALAYAPLVALAYGLGAGRA